MGESARCTLASFLDAPASAPPQDWTTAASHSNSAAQLDSTDLVERAAVARERTERARANVARLEGARTPQPSVDRATAVLVAAFNVSSSRAFECLLWVGEQLDVTPADAAERFMALVDARDREGRERSELLDILATLVGHAHPRAG